MNLVTALKKYSRSFRFLLSLLLALSINSSAENFSSLIKKLPNKDSIGIKILDINTQESIFEYNAGNLLKPASVMKAVTAASAFDTLGPDFKFVTNIYSNESGSNLDKLYVYGSGDPSFTIEDAWLIARKLKRRGVKKINELVIDNSYFIDPLKKQGQRSYLNGTSALTFNFNSISFEICPNGSGNTAIVNIDPVEQPVELVGKISTSSKRSARYSVDELPTNPNKPYLLRYKLGGSIYHKYECTPAYRSVNRPEVYFAIVFRGLLKEVGIEVGNSLNIGTLPINSKKLFSHSSKALSHIIDDMNHYSNNLMAEQIATRIGDGDRARGLGQIRNYLSKIGIQDNNYSIADASGLSHENKLSANLISQVLLSVSAKPEYYSDFEKSFAVSGKNGTLEKRLVGPKSMTIRAKTGTISKVTSLAGYAYGRAGNKYIFVILQNNVNNTGRAHTFEKNLLNYLYENY